MVFITVLEECCNLKPISLDAREEMVPYFKKAGYTACEYSFMTMYMWQHVFETCYTIQNDALLVMGRNEEEFFAIAPATEPQNYERALEALKEIFKVLKQPMVLRAVPVPFQEFIEANHPDAFTIEPQRDAFDYVYEGERLRTLSGRKMHSKKNHFNAFLKDYQDRFVYRSMTSKDFPEALELLQAWSEDKEKDKNLIGERLAIEKIFKNFARLPDTKVGGIYIEERLEAFSFGDMLTADMVVVHVEKANPQIRGLYPAINKLFLENEFPEVTLVNREDDLGLEGLRTAKLSYKPLELVEKYIIKEKPSV